ncbi:MAG: DNA alkylation repair protein [Campylobacteraceae bacterium]|jgi:3-methyladenine DNA glycosylase AlkD|nr:DNA alkylation repair protein [Campylobacteraceae bacterium]
MDFSQLKSLFSQNADSKQATKMSAYMQNKFAYFGIPRPKQKELEKQFFTNDKTSDPIDWQFIFDCFNANERELQYVALDYIKRHSKQLTVNDIPNLKRLIETKSWWDSVDCLDQIVGGIALKDEGINQTLLKWSMDKNFWLRRIAIDHQLGRKDKTNTELLATIIKNNFGQTEFFINKAIGWSLREYSKTNPKWVKDFIKQNEKDMAKLSIREASKYLQ